jgi:FkbM family methyltransferase
VTGVRFHDRLWRLVPDEAHPHELTLGRCRHGTFLYSRKDTIGRFLEQYGEWAEPEAALLASLLRPGDVVVDVGAHIGTLTVPLARAVGAAGSVLAFEPQPFLFRLLAANVALNGLDQVQVFEHGLGDKAERVWVRPIDYASGGNFGILSLDGRFAGKEGEGIGVRVWPLDKRAPGVDRCRLMKIDVEGLEDAVLAGAASLVARTRPLVYFEMNKGSQDAVLERLRGWRYRTYWHPVPLFHPANFAGVDDNPYGPRGDLNVLAVPDEMSDVAPDLVPATAWAEAAARFADLLFPPRKAARR